MTACAGCHAAPATVCDECRRALALRNFWTISRHPEAASDCEMCEAGPSQWCGTCLVNEVTAYRRELRALGHTIEEWPPSLAALQGHLGG